jgi:hypothetical protein
MFARKYSGRLLEDFQRFLGALVFVQGMRLVKPPKNETGFELANGMGQFGRHRPIPRAGLDSIAQAKDLGVSGVSGANVAQFRVCFGPVAEAEPPFSRFQVPQIAEI